MLLMWWRWGELVILAHGWHVLRRDHVGLWARGSTVHLRGRVVEKGLEERALWNPLLVTVDQWRGLVCVVQVLGAVSSTVQWWILVKVLAHVVRDLLVTLAAMYDAVRIEGANSAYVDVWISELVLDVLKYVLRHIVTLLTACELGWSGVLAVDLSDAQIGSLARLLLTALESEGFRRREEAGLAAPLAIVLLGVLALLWILV